MVKGLERFLSLNKKAKDILTAGAIFAYSLIPNTAYSENITITPLGSPTLSQAVTQSSYGDRITLTPGVYNASIHGHDIEWKDGVSINSLSNNPYDTIYDIQELGRAFKLSSDESDKNSLEGITIRNGKSQIPIEDVEPGFDETTGGGAILSDYSSLRIKKCNFINNEAYVNKGGFITDGGAIHSRNNSYFIISNSNFIGNHGNHIGGAIRFQSSRGLILNSFFKDNYAPDCQGGGAIAYTTNSSGLMANSIVHRNRSNKLQLNPGSGAGINIVNSNPLIINNTIIKNTTEGIDPLNGPSGEYGYGGGIQIGGLPYPKIINNISHSNIALPGLKDLDFRYVYPLSVSNCYLSELPLNFEHFVGKETIIINEDLGLTSSNPENIEDFSLSSDSLCIDSGTDIMPYLNETLSQNEITEILPIIEKDILGNSRKFNNVIDIGATEFTRNAVSEWNNYQ